MASKQFVEDATFQADTFWRAEDSTSMGPNCDMITFLLRDCITRGIPQ